jgi:hypothetical protein
MRPVALSLAFAFAPILAACSAPSIATDESTVDSRPWVGQCTAIATGQCSADKPYVCNGDRPPAYDCTRCGCPTGETCNAGVCLTNETIASRRNLRGIPDNLPIDDYFKFVDENATARALTYEAGAAEVVRRFRADQRRVVLNLGESHSSNDEQAVGLALVRDVVESGFRAEKIGVEGATPILDASPLADLGLAAFNIPGDLTNNAYCAAATREAAGLLNTDKIYVQYTGSGHTSQEACRHIEHYPICLAPHTAECVAKTGRLAETVMLFDPLPWLVTTDRTLLWRAGNQFTNPDAFDTELASIDRTWEQHLALQRREPMFDAAVGGRRVNVRFVPSPVFDDVIVAYFPRPEKKPFFLRSYRAAFAKPDLRAFMLANDLRPKACSIGWGSDGTGALSYHLFCSKSGRELAATVNDRFEIVESSMQ